MHGGHVQTLAYHWYGAHTLHRLLYASSLYRLVTRQVKVRFFLDGVHCSMYAAVPLDILNADICTCRQVAILHDHCLTT